MQPSTTLAEARPRVDRALLAIVAYAVLALLVVPVYPHFVSPNEFTRWLVDAAIVERGTIEVSAFAPLLGPRFEDLAIVGGRVYSNKAPGCAWIALPGYLAARIFVGPPALGSMRASLNAMRLVSATLPLLLTAILFRAAARRLEADRQGTAFAVATLLFALPTFAYGLLLFSHALVAAALFGAWWLLHGNQRSLWCDLAAGALIGTAVLSEYPAIFPAAVLLAPLLVGPAIRRISAVALGGLPFAAALALYQRAAFGSIFAMSYEYEKVRSYNELAHSGVFGIHFPSILIFARILFHPARGLLLFSPVLLSTIPAFAKARRRLSPTAWWTLLAVPLTILILYSGYPNWHGGWNVSVRYVVPALPFLAFPLCLVRPSGWMLTLFGASVAAVALTTLAFPFVPLEFALPWGSLALPLMGHGALVPTILAAVPPLAAGLAIGALVLAGSVLLLSKRQMAFFVAGAAATIGLALIVEGTASTLRQRVERGYIEDVYFEHPGALERVLPPGATVPPGLLQRRAYERQLPPPSR
jgi:hypothetical protein